MGLMVRSWAFHCRGLGSIPGSLVWELRSHITLLHAAAKKKKKSKLSPHHRSLQIFLLYLPPSLSFLLLLPPYGDNLVYQILEFEWGCCALNICAPLPLTNPDVEN